MTIEIKRSTEEEVHIISKIHASSWKAAYQGIVPQKYLDELQDDFWVPSFKHWISSNTLIVLLIYENSIPVGCIAYGKSRDESLPDWGEIVSLYIHPSYYRKGYGQKLLDAALAELRGKGYKFCYLWVLKENMNARTFYEKYGFKYNHEKYPLKIMGHELIDIRYVIDLTLQSSQNS